MQRQNKSMTTPYYYLRFREPAIISPLASLAFISSVMFSRSFSAFYDSSGCSNSLDSPGKLYNSQIDQKHGFSSLLGLLFVYFQSCFSSFK